jgi:hypothetical protein
MRFNEEDEKPDYFDGEDLPETEKEKREKFSREDPRYWDTPESEWEHLRPLLRFKLWAIIGGCIIAIILVIWLSAYYFRPYAEGCAQYGYVEKMQRRGTIFKTIEGRMIPYKNITDTTEVYSGDFYFTVTSEELAKSIDHLMKADKPMKLSYRTYHTAMPWRGESEHMVIAVDSVNENQLKRRLSHF